MSITIRQIAAIPLTMMFRPDLAPHLIRSGLLSFNNRMTLYRVELADGSIGYGDAMGEPTETTDFVGIDAMTGLRRIVHGGVQMALYDAVGKSLGVPAHALMGRQVRSSIALGYWTAEVPPEVLGRHVAEAAALGYRVYKTKCRPWWDPVAQVEAAAAAVGDSGLRLWLDFNGFLGNSRQALRVLRELARFDIVGGFESPIPQRDAEGYREIRAGIDRPVAAHFGSGCCHVRSVPRWDPGVPASEQISRNLCDAFVLGGPDVESLRSQAAVADEAGRPFWIQTIGSGLRAAWLAHLASTCRQATLSNLAAHTIWQRDLTELPAVRAGQLAVPEGPGLGVQLDEDAVEELRQLPAPEQPLRITTVVTADGTRRHFSSDGQRNEAFYMNEAVGFLPGTRLDTRTDDGSADFEDLFRRCSAVPVVESTLR